LYQSGEPILPAKKASKRPRNPVKVAAEKNNASNAGAACVVGIGASAGGFEAIHNLLKALPNDSGAAFVIVQHLDPHHRSLAAELFRKFTTMPVSEAVDGAALEANHVYTTPSDKQLTLKDHRLCLTPRSDHGHLHLLIDLFFNSLGENFGKRAIGIILSGSGSDGALGLKTIAFHEGIVLVQEPVTAEFNSMPRSAIATGVANYVLPVEQMAQVIADYAHHPYLISKKDDPNAEDLKAIQQLIKIIQSRRGYDFSGYKRSTFLRRVSRRMGLHGILRQAKYVTLLNKDVNEVDALFRDLLIGVTEFFRDAEAWKILGTEVISPLVKAKSSLEPIRIWIPGCSTGEEAYTMAIVVLERLRIARKKCPVQIFATDTNNEALEIGRLGRYPAGIATRINPTLLKRYFDTSENQEHYVVNDVLRASVVFGVQNIFSDPPFGRVDLISCRNVLIYLESELQKRVLNIFHFALARDSYLFLGSAESNGSRDDLFIPISKKWRIFRRESATRASLPSLPPKITDLHTKPNTISTSSVPQLSHVAAVTQRLILDRFAPASVLINSHYETLYFCGNTEEFLVRPRGAPTQDLLAMVREGLGSRMRAALREAATSHLTVNVDGARMKCGTTFSPVHITVAPTFSNDFGQLFLIVFRHNLKQPMIAIDKGSKAAVVRHLEDELQATRDDLQTTIERAESVYENLRIANEEVVTSNEELRSLNEELESSKEELQSLNEELTTVNQQLETKLRELEVSHNDLENLLTSSDIATICLDRSLRIKWFAPAAKKQFNFIDSDFGRPMSDLASAIEDNSLITAANQALANIEVKDHEFRVNSGQWYLRRVRPTKTDDAQISGVILTYTEITDIHQARVEADASRKDLTDTIAERDKLRVLSGALAMAEERERGRLAQYLHDDLGQLLAVIAIKVAEIKKHKVPKALALPVDECASVVQITNTKLREMTLQLNPPMLDQLGFETALEWMVDEVQRIYQLKVTIEDDGTSKPMDPAISATLFRAVRELLTNVSRHANIDKATVSMQHGAGNTLIVTVRDAGAGFELDTQSRDISAPMGGLGLLSVRERLGYLGGAVSVKSSPRKGTTVTLTVPLLSTTEFVQELIRRDAL
jgi:two-component system CheB/CheR fusion protein